jgi:hypothetical protein
VPPHLGDRHPENVAAVAIEEPQIAPNSAQAPMVAFASAPRTPENTALQAWNSSVAMLPRAGDRSHQDEQRDDRKRIGAGEIDTAPSRTSSAPGFQPSIAA